MRSRTLWGAAAAALLVVFGLVAARARGGGRSERGSATTALAGAEVGGCEEVRDGERCAVEAGATLVLWLPLDPTDRVVLPAGASTRRVAGGLQVRLVVSDPRQPVELAGERGAERWRWRVMVEPVGTTAALQAVLQLQRAGQDDAALVAIDAAWGGLSAAERARAEVARAQIAETRGQVDLALRHRARAVDEAVRAGVDSRAVKQHVATAFAHIYGRHDLAQARRELSAAERLRIDPARRAELDLARGWLADETGEVGAALSALAAAASQADRLDRHATAFAARTHRAALLGRLGRFDEALAGFRALVAVAGAEDDCAQARFWTTFAWQQMMVVEAGATVTAGAGDGSAVAQLDRALALERRCHRGTPDLPNVYVNRALAEAHAGRWSRARAWLRDETVTRAPVRLMVELWRQEVEARAALASGHAREALATYQRLEALARAAALADVRWQVLVGQARALRALGRRPAAIAAYRRAEALLDDQLLDIPLGQGRGTFVAARERATGELLEELAAAARAREATEVARRSRLRGVERLDRQARLAVLPPADRQRWDRAVGALRGARDALEAIAEARWALPASQLARAGAAHRRHEEEARVALATALDVLGRTGPAPADTPGPPGEGEVILGYHALPSIGPGPRWFGYAVSREGVMTRVLTASPAGSSPDALGQALLMPFAAVLARATRIRILAAGQLQAVDFHALPFDGAPLIATRQVVYGVDLPRRPRDAAGRAEQGPAKAVVVADPRGDLPQARREGDDVLARLRPRFARIVQMLGAETQAVSARLRAELRGAQLFHYAGHARQAGTDSIDSGLVLSAGQELSIAELLTLEHAPDEVVLSGCETGRGDWRGVADLGLAQAFVLAGSEQVVASTRRVDDRTARALMTALYERGHEDLSVALQEAQRALSARSEPLDWSAFRAIVR